MWNSLFLFLILAPLLTFAETDVRVELGNTEVHSNYFRVPKSATRVAFPDGEQVFTGRVYASWKLDEDNSLRLLIAPLKASATITPDSNVDFRGSTFTAGAPVDVDYTFNSYRLSYIRQWKSDLAFRPHVGFTAKIRDAEIKLSSATQSAKRANVGFVPLLNFGFEYSINEAWLAYFDLDGAAATQGRALDGVLEARYMGFESVDVGTGIRVLDGGINTDSNENFAQLRTWFLSLSRSF